MDVYIYRILMLLMGLIILVSTLLKKGWVYRLLHARAKILWRDYTDYFLIAISLIIIVLSILWTFGIIWK